MVHRRLRRLMLQRTVAAVALGVLACSDDPVAPGPEDVPATITPARQWSGGTVSVKWPWLAGQSELPEFLLAGEVVPVERVSDEEIRLALPPVGSSRLQLAALVDAETIVLGEVDIAGHSGILPMPALGGYEAYLWPDVTGTELVGQVGDRVVLVDLTTGTSRDAGLPSRPTRGWQTIGWSYIPGAVVLPPTNTAPAETWSLVGVPAKLGDAGAAMDDDWHQAVETAPGTYIYAEDSYQHAYRDGSGLSSLQYLTSPGEFVLSPAGGRIAQDQLRPADGQERVHLLDPATGAIATLLDEYVETNAVAFSADGSRLHLYGRRADAMLNSAYTLATFDPADGTLLRDVVPPGGNPPGNQRISAVAAHGGRVFLALEREVAGEVYVALLVYRAADLSLEAELRVQDDATLGQDPVLALSADGTRAYLADWFLAGELHHFDLLPE
jgi:hypothetical protein